MLFVFLYCMSLPYFTCILCKWPKANDLLISANKNSGEKSIPREQPIQNKD